MKHISTYTALAVIVVLVISIQQFMTKAYTASEREPEAKMGLAEFADQKFSVMTSELSPAAVINCRSNTLGLFKNMDAWGLGAPSYAAVPSGNDVKVIKAGEKATGMSEPWIVTWFNGSPGWDYWDAPVILVLQKRPSSVSLSKDGLDISFPKQAGFLTFMPLYGYCKIPLSSDPAYLKAQGMLGRGISTDVWKNGLPKQVIARCRKISRMMRAVPVYCREDFSIDGDDILIRSKFNWLTIQDEWGTKPQKLAPLSPTLALAWWSGKHSATKPFPMTFSQPVEDAGFTTQYGPYAGVPDTDSYTVRMPVLKYVHFIEDSRKPDLSNPQVAEAYKRMEERLTGKFRNVDWNQIWDHGGPKNYCWQAMGDRWYGKALPYLPADARINMKLALRSYLSEYVLQESNYKQFEGMLLVTGPGVGTWGGYDDAGKFSSNLLESIWNTAYYTDSLDIVKQRWPTVKKFFVTPLECDWKSFGRYEIAELGDEAAPALSMARLAYKVGDQDTYAFASYIFARELVHHYVKQVGAAYFLQQQPWNSDDVMPHEIYLTNMHDKLSAWQIDGPGYPKDPGEKQFNNRWVRFSCDEVARFYRDVLSPEVTSEMNMLTERARLNETPLEIKVDTAHIQPSIVRLRAMLLGESPEKLSQIAPPGRWKVNRAADVAAMCLPFIKNSRPIEWARLIQPQKTDFALGLERTGLSDDAALTLITASGDDAKTHPQLRNYPLLRWSKWKAPKTVEGIPGGKYRNFGQIVPGGFRPGSSEVRRLNWNTQVWVCR